MKVQDEQRTKRSVSDIIGGDKPGAIIVVAAANRQQHDQEPVASPAADDSLLKTLDDAAIYSKNSSTNNNAVCSNSVNDGLSQVGASAGTPSIDNAYNEDFFSESAVAYNDGNAIDPDGAYDEESTSPSLVSKASISGLKQ